MTQNNNVLEMNYYFNFPLKIVDQLKANLLNFFRNKKKYPKSIEGTAHYNRAMNDYYNLFVYIDKLNQI